MAATRAEERRDRIRFERTAAVRNSLGVKAPGVATVLGSRLAKVLYGTGAERRAAAAEGAVQSATFRVLADSLTRTITVTDAILFGEHSWDITGIAPIAVVPAEIEFTATASVG